MFVAMPSPMQIYAAVDSSLECPLTVREGRSWLSEIFKSKKVKQRGITDTQELNHHDPIIRLKEVWFRYEKDGNDIVKGVSVDIPKASLFCIVGGNGTGKSTTLKIMSGILHPYRGKVLINGKDIKKYTNRDLFVGNLAVLPQDPQSLFVKKNRGAGSLGNDAG